MSFDDFGLIGSLSSVFASIGEFFSSLWDTLFEKTIRSLITEGGLLGSIAEIAVPDAILDASLGWLILGAGLSVYLVYQLVTWILNVIT